MKILSILFFLSSFFTTSTTTETTTTAELVAKPGIDVSIVGANSYNLCNSTANWQVYVCNNSPTATVSTTVDITLEPCPFQFVFVTASVNSLPPQTCTIVSGTLANPCGCLFIADATVDPNNLINETNENNNSGSGGGCC